MEGGGWKANKDFRANTGDIFEKELSAERERLGIDNKYSYDYPTINDSETAELKKIIIRELFHNSALDNVRDELSAKLAESSLSQSEKEDMIFAFFEENKDVTFALKGADYVFSGKDMFWNGRSTRFDHYDRNCLYINCFPSNYIDSDGWINRNNRFSVSFEEITAGFISASCELLKMPLEEIQENSVEESNDENVIEVSAKLAESENETEETDAFSDINTEEIRQRLEEVGIVNGEVVDEEKLNNSPFIRMVEASVQAASFAENNQFLGTDNGGQH